MVFIIRSGKPSRKGGLFLPLITLIDLNDSRWSSLIAPLYYFIILGPASTSLFIFCCVTHMSDCRKAGTFGNSIHRIEPLRGSHVINDLKPVAILFFERAKTRLFIITIRH